MTIDRRALIRASCMTAGALAAPRWAAAGVFRRPREARAASPTDTVLVLVKMDGGNDGLNTVVPFADRAYAAARPRIALTGSQLLPLEGGFGLHPSLSRLHGHLGSGRLAIVQSVGYPRPDMSHFRSDDIWEKATLAPEALSTGWLGRALDQLYGQDADGLHSVSVSGDVPALRGDRVTTPVVDGSFSYPHYDPSQTDALRALLAPGGAPNRDWVAHVGRLALADSDTIEAAGAAYSSSIVYPEGGFAGALRSIASMILADAGPRMYFVIQGGYDTHSNQLGDHEKLLLELDGSLDAFYRDLVDHGQDQRVVILTYSEFGRRVEDNASGGTDHGSAGPMFVLGSRVRGGLYGSPPSLNDLDPDGNLKFRIDFRQVYASILADWIGADPVEVLFDSYASIPFL